MDATAKNRIAAVLLIVLLLSGLLLTGCSNPSEPGITSISSPGITAAYPQVDDYIIRQMQADNIPGMAVTVVRGVEVVYCKGLGVASIGTDLAVTPQTIFDLASASKSFTALGVLLLRDTGLIDLDAPVQIYLPDFQPNDPLSVEITVRQLLEHTSGLPGTFSAPLIFQQGDDDMAALVAAAGRLRLNRKPGSSFEYADINYCLLGALIERVSGAAFEDYLQQKIFTPLGMANTTLYPGEADAKNRADGHQSMYGQVVARNIPVYRSALPAGWVMSCAEDMGKWLIMHLNGGYAANKQLFSPADISEAHTPAVMFEENGEEMGYGMGWFTSSADGVSLVWHGGDTPNFTADMVLLPEYETGVVVLVNSQACTVGHSIASGVLNTILGLDLEPMQVPWWAHWQAIDRMATVALAFILILLLAMPIYALYMWRQFRTGKLRFVGSAQATPMLPKWQLAFYIVPVLLMLLFVLAGYLVIKTLYGYNLFEVLFLFRLGAPPGVYISGVSLLVTIFLWTLVLAFIGLFIRSGKEGA